MRTRPRPDAPQSQLALLVVVALAATFAGVLVASLRGGDETTSSAAVLPASAWYGLVGAPPVPVSVGERAIVMLKTPSLAQRVARAGGHASEAQERQWTAANLAVQRQLVADLALRGIRVRPEFQFARVLSGFSAAVGPAALPVLERMPGVAGVYPVRIAYPAAAPAATAEAARFGVRLPGASGRGITIALLDTGVDRSHPYLADRVRPGYDVVSRDEFADAERQPGDTQDVEEHGTKLAGILVGTAGRGATPGLAPGARVFPVRVAGWQLDARGRWAVYARTDQLIAGLERAVDPNADGDSHDAARVAVIGVAEPYAAFGDGPEATAVQGAVDLDTVVVAPAGNDGPAGPKYGSIAGPGGASAALTVGSAELRGRAPLANVALQVGLDRVFDGAVPLAGHGSVPARVSLPIALPRREPTAGLGGDLTLGDFFDPGGFSLVAGQAALVSGGAVPEHAAASAAAAGARAVVLYGGRLPSVSLDLAGAANVPVVGVPEPAGRAIVRAIESGTEARVSIAPAGAVTTVRAVAPFSSHGLAFDGRLKPDLVAPGVGLVAAEPGQSDDASPRVGSISGASAATAVTGAAVALLAQARPDLDAVELKGVLVGSARRLPGTSRTAQGAGLLDLDAAAAAELAAEPTTLAFHLSAKADWRESQGLVLRNVSTRALRVSVRGEVDSAPAGATLHVYPRRFLLRPGKTARVYAEAALAKPTAEPLTGAVNFELAGRHVLTVPWAAAPGVAEDRLLRAVRLSDTSFHHSDNAPAVLSFAAGRLMRGGSGYEVQAVARLDLEVRRVGARKPLGLLAQLRHLLPGRYAFGLTGRGPQGKVLRPGHYELRLLAYPTGSGPPTRRVVHFTLS